MKQGDFLQDPHTHSVLSRSDVIFVNNYAFDSVLNQDILALFLDLKEGAQVISLRSFLPPGNKQLGRRANSIENIFKVKEYIFGRDQVSWMMEGGKYFIHTVDRNQLRDN